MTRILVVDNYDSFVYTLVGYLTELGADTVVVRNDEIEPDAVAAAVAGFDGVLVSPGPGAPSDAGISEDVVHAAALSEVPLLGVCLGHQAIAELFGAEVSNASELMHGMVSAVIHDGSPLFDGLATTFSATRYHSLAVRGETIPPELVVTARTAGGIVMAVQHRSLPIFGVQFHPESVLTEGGYRLLANWLSIVGEQGAVERSAELNPWTARRVGD